MDERKMSVEPSRSAQPLTPDERAFACPECGGDGGWEWWDSHVRPDPITGDPERYWQVCRECDGQGEVIVRTSLIEEDNDFLMAWGEA